MVEKMLPESERGRFIQSDMVALAKSLNRLLYAVGPTAGEPIKSKAGPSKIASIDTKFLKISAKLKEQIGPLRSAIAFAQPHVETHAIAEVLEKIENFVASYPVRPSKRPIIRLRSHELELRRCIALAMRRSVLRGGTRSAREAFGEALRVADTAVYDRMVSDLLELIFGHKDVDPTNLGRARRRRQAKARRDSTIGAA